MVHEQENEGRKGVDRKRKGERKSESENTTSRDNVKDGHRREAV